MNPFKDLREDAIIQVDRTLQDHPNLNRNLLLASYWTGAGIVLLAMLAAPIALLYTVGNFIFRR